MSLMDALGFKFNIGDVCRHAQELPKPKPGPEVFITRAEDHMPARYHIISRIAEECPGGIQLHYICRSVRADGHVIGRDEAQKGIRFLEHELKLEEIEADEEAPK